MGIIMRFAQHWILLGILLLAFGCKAKAQQFRTHAVKQGETLESVAQQYQVSTQEILRFNKELTPDTALRPNTIIVIPSSGAQPVASGQQQTRVTDTTEIDKPIGFQSHRVRRKETLYSISRRYEVSEDRLKRYNPDLYSGSLQKGMMLRIPRYAPGTSPDPEAGEIELISYKVQPRETRWSIAHKFKITVDSLVKLNPELPDNTSYLAAGQELKLPKPAGSDIMEEAAILYTSFTVPPKQTLYSLSQEYGISREEILRLNPEIVEQGGLKEGMVLRLPEKQPESLPESEYVFYEVRPKQTQYSLTRQLGIGYADLLNANPEIASGLKAGMVLQIPRDKAMNLEVKNDLVLPPFSLKDSINTENIPRVLVLLPFRLDRLDLDDDEGTQKRIEQNNALQYSLGLYSGFLVALDSIAELGVSVDVKTLDTELSTEHVQNLMLREDLGAYSAILGPLSQESIKEVASKASELNVPVVAPLPIGQEIPMENLFYSFTPEARLRTHMLDFVKEQVNDEKILIISDQKNQDAEMQILETFPAATLVELREEEENISLDLEVLVSQLSQEAENWIFVETDDFKIASSVSSILNSANSDTTQIRMLTTHRNKAFENDVISVPHLSKLKFTFPSVTRESTTAAFARRYRRRFSGEPDRYAVRGFDLGMDMLLRLAYDLDLFKVADQIGEVTYTGNKFNYWKGWQTGYYNTASYILMYEDLQIKELKDP
ncbi:LysM peptidoglycan-binding domain-containing protein [Robiginitalea sp. M39]|uniref:LysM peptidoglycan-binding domain-containing protein n=2 Tax=Robiginitalea aurantiaca TaxID=3056915 RepID=A0ABT7WI95_9FLAO|nr:LysM peptidoglycan-binding domain-containing protein [Robiginitalea aurantiaca]